jgi:hypothetical protein
MLLAVRDKRLELLEQSKEAILLVGQDLLIGGSDSDFFTVLTARMR